MSLRFVIASVRIRRGSFFFLLSVSALGACATVPAGHRAVLTTFDGATRTLDEGVAVVPLFSKVDDFDLRQQGQNENFMALTADGVPIRAGDLLVTYQLIGTELVAADREVGPHYAVTLIDPIVQSAARKVLASFRWFELDTAHIRQAEAQITAIAAAELVPHHIHLHAVQLRGLFVDLTLFNRSVSDTSVWDQRAQEARLRLDVARQQAQALHQEAIGLLSAYRLIAPSLTESALQDEQTRAWGLLLSSRSATVQALDDSLACTVEIPP